MGEMKEVRSILNQLKGILQMEKECLVKNDVGKLESLIEKKRWIIDLLEQPVEKTSANSTGCKDLIDEIQLLQQTNLMLTKQAIGFQNVLFRAMGEKKNSKFKTYDAIGKINGKSEASIIDHSV